MPRYIDADALYKETEKKIKEANSYRMAVVDRDFLDIINDADTADVVEVVRCKDCKHNTDNGGDCDRTLIHTRRNLVTETNEYLYFKLNCCEYGERKEGEKDA